MAEHLRDLGFTASATDVVTSAQSAAHLLAGQLSPDSPVLIVGTDALANEIAAVGLRPVRRYEDDPVAVVQGLSMTIGWPDLAEAALAIRAGALWVAANVDPTLPTERGLLPGNGRWWRPCARPPAPNPRSRASRAPGLLTDAVARGDFRAPLVIGDRLDTDIEGANTAGLPSLMVLTGVNTARDAVYAKPAQRPTYIGHDLRSLHQDGKLLEVGPQPGWRVDVGEGRSPSAPTAGDDGDGLSIVRAVGQRAVGAQTDGSTACASRPATTTPASRCGAGILWVVLNDTLHHRIGGVLVKARLCYSLGFRSSGNTGVELLLDLAGELQTEWVGFPQRESGSACLQCNGGNR